MIWRGQQVLRNPSNAELGRLLGLRAPPAPGEVCDLVIVGAGPAGLAAAVYATSDGLDALVLDAIATGGQAATSSRIENYLGFPEGISGAELADRALIQARKFGARISVPAEATELGRRGGNHVVALDDGEGLECRTVLIATGARYRRLDVPRLEDFEKSSVYYAATPIEAQQCVGDPGGGGRWRQLGRTGDAVPVEVCRERAPDRQGGRADGAHVALSRRQDRAELRTSRCCSIARSVSWSETTSSRRSWSRTTAAGSAARSRRARCSSSSAPIPARAGCAGELELDDGGYVLTGPATGSGGLLETSRPGVFAAGDVRSGSAQRVAGAVGEGAMAVRLVHEHLRQTYA